MKKFLYSNFFKYMSSLKPKTPKPMLTQLKRGVLIDHEK